MLEVIKYCVFGILLFSAACTPSSQDVEFKAFIKNYQQAKWKQFPIKATQAGHRQFEKILPIPNKLSLNSNLTFCKKYKDSLQRFDLSRLSTPLQFEYKKINPFLTNYIQNIDVKEIHKNDPTFYNLGHILKPDLTLGNIQTEQPSKILERKLAIVPDYYSAAKDNLSAPDQKKINLAIEQQIQFYKLLDQQLNKIKTADLPAPRKKTLEQLTFNAKLCVKDFIAFCKSKAFESIDTALDAERIQSSSQLKEALTIEEK